jgi:hypothetical protein
MPSRDALCYPLWLQKELFFFFCSSVTDIPEYIKKKTGLRPLASDKPLLRSSPKAAGGQVGGGHPNMAHLRQHLQLSTEISLSLSQTVT